MRRGFSVHIGVSSTNGHAGPIGTAVGCDHAAEEMHALATRLGFSTSPLPLVNGRATHDAVIEAIEDACCKVGDKELLVITLAGHGRQLAGPGHGNEVHDQALVLYDEYLVDDEMYAALSKVQPTAQVVVVADGCFMGSILTLLTLFRGTGTSTHVRSHARPPIDADVLLIPATSSTSVASALQEGNVPLFTRALLETREGSTSYENLVRRINTFIGDRAPKVTLNTDLLHEGSTLPCQRPFQL